MARSRPFDVVGGAYSDDTRPWSVQDTVNYLVVNAERPGGRSPKMLRDAPGMVTFCASMPESSVRGLYVAEGRLFAVVGTTLYSIGTDGWAASLGTIPGVGRCVFTHNQIANGNEVVIGNGQSGYVYDTVAGTLTQITDEGFPGFRSVDFADQYVIGVEPFGRYWFHSDLADAKSYNTLDRAEAEKAPDRIQQAIATGSDVLVLGERTGQFFYNTGEATGTWSNRSGAEMDVGAASPWTACRLDNTVYWLGNDGSVYRLNGYVPQRISTHALEQAISRCNLSDAYAFTFEDRGHKCYLLTFPDGRTWCFDAATQEWTRRESYGFDRWRVSALVKWGRHWIAGDFINGRLYQLDWSVKQEAGEPLERRRVTGALHDDQNRLIVNAFELVFDTGMDEDSPPLPQPILAPLAISGDVPDGRAGDAISGAYTVSGGVKPYGSVTVTAGTFPPGLTLNANGTYSGSYSTVGSYAWTVGVTDADGNPASVADTAEVIDVTLERGLRPKVTSWWDFEDGITDLARGGNGYSGSVTYEPNATATGNRLAAGVVPLSTTTSYGYNLHQSDCVHTDCAFGARLSVSKLTDCETLLTVGLDNGATVAGSVSIGIIAGKWVARVFDAVGAVIFTGTSVANAVINTETHVGMDMVYGGSTTSTLRLWINGVNVASHVSSGSINATFGTFVIGTRAGGGYRPTVSEMFWAHDSFTAAEWVWLYNSGNRRFYAEIAGVTYGTTYDTFMASVMAARNGGIYTLNNTLADSATFGPVGAATLANGAVFSTAIAAPPGFGASQVVALDGDNDVVVTPDMALGSDSAITFGGWSYQTANGADSDVIASLGFSAVNMNFSRSIRQGVDATQLTTEYRDSSANVFTNMATVPTRVGGWRFVVDLGSGGAPGGAWYPVLNGITAGRHTVYPSLVQNVSLALGIGGRPYGANGMTGYVSRSFVTRDSVLRLPQLAKLYDLGMGSS